MTRPRIQRLGVFLLACALSAVTPSLAQSEIPDQTVRQGVWHFDVTPYLWGAGLDGDVGIGQLPSGGVQANFSDILNVLDLGLMLGFSGRRDRWGFLVDGVYVDLTDTVPASNDQFGEARTEIIQELYTFGGTYRALDGKTALDIVAGARSASLSADLELTGGIASGRKAEQTRHWWDGFAGARGTWTLGKHWSVVGYTDIGAGGAKITWQVLGGADYAFNKTIALKFGYRYLKIDYDKDDFLYDMAMAGPYLGAGFQF